MHRFFAKEVLGDEIKLDSEESRHLAKVLRLKTGDEVAATDGMGKLYLAVVQEANPKEAVLKILSTQNTKEGSFYVEIAAAPTKNINRWEWFLEKSTEIGIDAIHPITTDKSERKVLKEERQIRILKSAMKQSLKLKLPRLSALQKFEAFVSSDFDGEKYIAHCHDSDKMPLKQHPKGTKALILIGPEGGFSIEEIKTAKKFGFKAVSLGSSRLRTETAAIVACHTINLINA